MSRSVISLAALRQRATIRPPGYVEDVLAAASEVNDTHVILRRKDYLALRATYASGPGTELKALLKAIGIVASPTCSCNKRAMVMDEKGCDWCEENLDQISGWLAEEAKKRGLPYIPLAGKTLVRLAVRKARKKGNS